MIGTKNGYTRKSAGVSFSDVDETSRDGGRKPPVARELSIVEEGDDGEQQETTKFKINNNNTLKLPDHSYEKDQTNSAGSSNENLSRYQQSRNKSAESSRRPSFVLQELLSTRRPSAIMASLRRGSQSVLSSFSRSKSDDPNDHIGFNSPEAIDARRKNRRQADDAISAALSALYAKVIVIIGIALPITEILTSRIPNSIYQGFYVYLYAISIAFVVFVYVMQFRRKAVFTLIKNYHEKAHGTPIKQKYAHFGSFYLRAGAITFGIGNMVYSGLEMGQYFEMQSSNEVDNGCHHIFMLLTPLFRMCLTIAQMQFIFLNTTEMDHGYHKVISRFGLMHMVATNLCDWFSVLVEETKHEIIHLAHGHDDAHHHIATAAEMIIAKNSTHHDDVVTLNGTILATDSSGHVTTVADHLVQKYQECQRSNIMGKLVQNSSPFLFPCTIEYALVCAVVLFEMWKKVRSIPEINKTRRNSIKPGGHGGAHHPQKSAYHFSIDCSKAHRGMFAGIVVIVMTIICLIMYFVLHQHKEYDYLAIKEVTYYEIVIYSVCTTAVIVAFIRMRDLKFNQVKGGVDHHASTVKLDCSLLVMAAVGVYVYGMFSIIGSVFAFQDTDSELNADTRSIIAHAIVSELLSLIEVSLQTLFILNACWRRCKGAQQIREKPGRQIVTFLLVANISMWFINTLIKGHASFRPSHLEFYGKWAWVIITHVSMPLAIFYRFHSTICLFDIWKSAYKFKVDH